MAGEVSVGKLVWPKASQPEIKRDCDRIDGFIDVITADLDNITKKYNEVAEYATDTDTITRALTPHLCRCGSHPRVMRAVKQASIP